MEIFLISTAGGENSSHVARGPSLESVSGHLRPGRPTLLITTKRHKMHKRTQWD